MGCINSKEGGDKPAPNNAGSGGAPEKEKKNEKNEKAEKAAPSNDNAPAKEQAKPAAEEPPAVVIPKGEPIKLDELDEDFILFEPIEDFYELGEEIGK